MPGPILLTGVNGQIGSELLPLLQQLGPVVAPTRHELDLTCVDAIRDLVRSVRPRWIINPAAYTAVDNAESDQDTAYTVNAEAPRVLGEEAVRLGSPVLHFSTDYVFSGTGDQPWREDDLPGPLNIYGASKLAGEQALLATGAAVLVLRTSWVYSTHGKNFLLTILRAARERPRLKIVDDQHGAPTWARDLARLTLHIVRHIDAEAAQMQCPLADAAGPLSGIYHACCAGHTSWFGFASEFLALAKAGEPTQTYAELAAIPSSEFPMIAKRPQNSLLNTNKLEKTFGITLPHWRESIAAVMAERHFNQ